MDDKRFDDGVKNKIGEFEDPHFDPSALAALHRQVAVVSSWAWYAQYRTELIVGSSLAFCTLVILWSQWFMGNNTRQLVNEKTMQLQSQQSEIAKLQEEIYRLKGAAPDTIRIIEVRVQPSSNYNTLIRRITLLEAAMNSNQGNRNSQNGAVVQNLSQTDQFAWTLDAISDTSWYAKPNTAQATGIRQQEVPDDKGAAKSSSSSEKLSVKTLRDIEEHYQRGVGIRVGPVVEASKGFYHPGTGRFDVATGVLADFILSPSLSVETGAKFIHRFYEVSDLDNLSNMDWPALEESLGTLKMVDVDSWILEIPVNLKYRYPISLKSHWLGSVGYSGILYTTQVLEYEYGMESNPSATVNSDYRKTKATLYPGTLNISLGLAHRLKNKKILETSVYYQTGTGNMGIENSKPNFLGVRGVYWFSLR